MTLPDLIQAAREIPGQGLFFAGYAFSIATIMSTRIWLQSRKERDQTMQMRLAALSDRHKKVRSLDASSEHSLRLL